MLRQSSSKKGSHIIWDEDNLRVNAEIQKEYSGIKVDEPKTPYHRPFSADDEFQGLEEDMKPLELDEAGAPSAADDAATAHAAVMTAFDYVMSNGGADFSPPEPSERMMSSSGDAAADNTNEPTASATSEEGGHGHNDKKRRFAEMRKQHYNMKDALKQARQLLASEDGDEGNEEELDTAGCDAITQQDSESRPESAAANGDIDHADVPDQVLQPYGVSQQQSNDAGTVLQQSGSQHDADQVQEMEGS